MKRILNITGGLLGLLALGALVVALAFTFGELRTGTEPLSQAFPAPIEAPTQPPYPPPRAAMQPPYPPPGAPTPPGPSATLTAAPIPAPPCTFAARPAPVVLEPSLEAYHFSEPRVVLTHTSAIGIAGWLPDSQRLLITRDIPSTNRQTIETLSIRTGEIQAYAHREGANGKPVWLSGPGGVAYSTLIERQHELWISQGDPVQVEQIAPNIEGLSLAVDPTGQRLLYFPSFASGQPRLLDVASRIEKAMSLNLAQWQYPRHLEPVQSMLTPSTFRIAWHPDGSQLVFYTLPWTFLLDLKTNQVCEIDLGQFKQGMVEDPVWALEAKWSPDGRYLALITTGSFPGQASGTGAPILFTELTFLDMETGELRTLQPAPDINSGQHYVTNIAWAPDSSHLAALAVVRRDDVGFEYDGLFILDAIAARAERTLPEHEFGGGGWSQAMAWSPDGRQLALNCPTWNEGRLCLITVTLRQ